MYYTFIISERQGQTGLHFETSPEFSDTNNIVQMDEIALREFLGIPTQWKRQVTKQKQFI